MAEPISNPDAIPSLQIQVETSATVVSASLPEPSPLSALSPQPLGGRKSRAVSTGNDHVAGTPELLRELADKLQERRRRDLKLSEHTEIHSENEGEADHHAQAPGSKNENENDERLKTVFLCHSQVHCFPEGTAMTQRFHMRRFNKLDQIMKRMKKSKTSILVFEDRKRFFDILPQSASGYSIISWMCQVYKIAERSDAVAIATRMVENGYLIPAEISGQFFFEDNEEAFYAHQAECFWPSMYWKGNDLDYAAFLDRRRTSPTLYELSRQENDNLDRFRSQTEHWPSIQKQAEEQAAFYAGMSKSDKKLMEMREVMFWRTHRPHVYAMTSAGSTEPAEIGQSVVGKDTERNRLSEEEFTNRLDPETSLSFWQRRVENLQRHLLNYTQHHSSSLAHRARNIMKTVVAQTHVDPLLPQTDQPNRWTLNDSTWSDPPPTDPSSQDARRWSLSLRHLLQDPRGVETFRTYLATTHAEELVECWEAIQKWQLHEQDDVNLCKQSLQSIYTTFVKAGADKEVPLTSVLVKALEMRLKKDAVDAWMLEDIRSHLFRLMQADAYPKYLKTEAFKQLLDAPVVGNKGADWALSPVVSSAGLSIASPTPSFIPVAPALPSSPLAMKGSWTPSSIETPAAEETPTLRKSPMMDKERQAQQIKLAAVAAEARLKHQTLGRSPPSPLHMQALQALGSSPSALGSPLSESMIAQTPTQANPFPASPTAEVTFIPPPPPPPPSMHAN